MRDGKRRVKSGLDYLRVTLAVDFRTFLFQGFDYLRVTLAAFLGFDYLRVTLAVAFLFLFQGFDYLRVTLAEESFPSLGVSDANLALTTLSGLRS